MPYDTDAYTIARFEALEDALSWDDGDLILIDEDDLFDLAAFPAPQPLFRPLPTTGDDCIPF